ncbi:MAG: hypothetical protein SPM02_00900 [Bacteroidales bacterium]|nr:hypothetical protein [Bacteroidales bacterium]
MNTCNTCMQCSLDGIYCHLHRRPTDPEGSCPQHSQASDRLTQLRLTVRQQTSKKININNQIQ